MSAQIVAFPGTNAAAAGSSAPACVAPSVSTKLSTDWQQYRRFKYEYHYRMRHTSGWQFDVIRETGCLCHDQPDCWQVFIREPESRQLARGYSEGHGRSCVETPRPDAWFPFTDDGLQRAQWYAQGHVPLIEAGRGAERIPFMPDEPETLLTFRRGAEPLLSLDAAARRLHWWITASAPGRCRQQDPGRLPNWLHGPMSVLVDMLPGLSPEVAQAIRIDLASWGRS